MRIYHEASKASLCGGIDAGEHANFTSWGLTLGVELQPLVDSQFPGIVDTRNDALATVFYVEREHGSVEAAQDFYFQHALALAAQARSGTFTFVSEVGGRAAFYYAKNAILKSVVFSEPPVGSSTLCTYTLQGGAVTRTP